MKMLSAIISFGVVIPSFSVWALERLPGMEQEVEIRSAKELGISAPSGEYVAVLDQSVAGSDVQDHHNGWFQLSTNEVDGNVLTVKGKYYLPGSAAAPAQSLRFTIRKRAPEGLVVLSEHILPIDGPVDQWSDFQVELPIEANEDLSRQTLILMLSAQPLAGPLYVDDLVVTDTNDNSLWEFPEFEKD